MISGLSKSVTLYLAPVLMLTTLFLNSFSFFAPTQLLHDQVALLTVTPSTSLVKAGPSQDIDGPSVFLGLLGSCARTSNAGQLRCTHSSAIKTKYDLGVLPDKAPETLLSPPPSSTPSLIALSLSCALVFFLSFTCISFRHKLGGLGKKMEMPVVQRLSAWVGFFGFIIGIACYLIVRMWFEKAIQDFNNNIALQGSGGPQLIASSGNGFTMIWVGFAFYAVPLCISLSKLNVQATKDA